MTLVLVGLVCAIAQAIAVVPAAKVPFSVGEKLSYRIFWGPVLVGSATLEVEGIDQIDGHECYRIVARAQTVGIGRLLYPINSVTESWVDTAGLFSRRFRQDRQEGKSSNLKLTDFDYENQQAVTRNLKNGKQRVSPLPKPAQDLISSVYYMRAQQLAINKEESFVVNASETNWKVSVKPDQRREMNVRPVGDVQALRLEPSPTLNVVAQNDGRLWFWMSDDARHLPLVLNSTMSIGSAKMVLHKVEQLQQTEFPSPSVIGASR